MANSNEALHKFLYSRNWFWLFLALADWSFKFYPASTVVTHYPELVGNLVFLFNSALRTFDGWNDGWNDRWNDVWIDVWIN